jgi:hypothetical protein
MSTGCRTASNSWTSLPRRDDTGGRNRCESPFGLRGRPRFPFRSRRTLDHRIAPVTQGYRRVMSIVLLVVGTPVVLLGLLSYAQARRWAGGNGQEGADTPVWEGAASLTTSWGQSVGPFARNRMGLSCQCAARLQNRSPAASFKARNSGNGLPAPRTECAAAQVRTTSCRATVPTRSVWASATTPSR